MSYDTMIGASTNLSGLLRTQLVSVLTCVFLVFSGIYCVASAKSMEIDYPRDAVLLGNGGTLGLVELGYSGHVVTLGALVLLGNKVDVSQIPILIIETDIELGLRAGRIRF